jgi:serine/threonine-protein kinase
VLGGYEVVSELGRGGMGCVYKARDRSLDRLVALKVLPQELTRSEDFVQRFTREARIAARLNHSAIVHVYAFGQDAGTWYLAMELIDGYSLGAYLRAGYQFSEEHTIRIGRHAATALGAAHEAGIVHRDVKPENLMMSSKGDVKLVDLGLAKDLDDDAGLTATGSAMGTPHFISPEQLRGRKDLDGRTDVYSLGATLYRIATGHVPFSGDSVAVIMSKHLNEPPPHPRAFKPELSEGLSAVILAMMAKDPADRYPDMQAVDRDLDRVLQGQAPQLPRASGALPSPAPPDPTELSTVADDPASLSGAPTLLSPPKTADSGLTRAPSASLSSGGSESGMSDPLLLKAYEKELTRFVGPMARVLVRRAAKASSSPDELAERLARELSKDEERAAFLAAIHRG